MLLNRNFSAFLITQKKNLGVLSERICQEFDYNSGKYFKNKVSFMSPKLFYTVAEMTE